MTEPQSVAREALAHVDALYNHARRIVQSAADADELVQETYVRVLASAHTFLGGNLKGWLFRILQNTHIDMRRRNRRQPAVGDYDISDDAVEATLVRNSSRVDELRGLVTEEIEAALANLSDDARTIVLLDLEGFTESEVADVIGCRVGTVKSRLSRARAILRERLSEHAPPNWRREHTKAGEK
jgi:RNA polymerase sigma-70 factor (ECF subfamily)